MSFEASEIGTPTFYALWALMALINAVLYAVIGATYIALRKRLKRAVTNSKREDDPKE
jgi:hypothetical protein